MYRKFTATICAVLIAFLYCAHSVQAAPTIITRSEWRADDKVLKSGELYRYPTNIKIVPIKLPKDFWVVSSDKLVQNLYYYFATRSSFGSIPFHYVVGFDGKVFQTAKYSDFEQISFAQDEESLVIGVMSKNSDDKIGILNLDSVQNLASELSNLYNISPENVSVLAAKFTFNASEGVDSIAFEKSSDTYAQETVKTFVTEKFNPKTDTYKLSIDEIKFPTQPLKENETATVEIKIKNDSSIDLFGSKNSKLTLKKSDGEKSSFYDEPTWDSLDSVVLLNSGARLEKGQTGSYTITIKAPLGFGAYSENFDVIYAGVKLSNTDITVNLAKPDGTIIEIKPNDAGYLNVRENPPFGNVVTQVLPGEKFVVLEEITGYYKIKTKDGKEGWVSSAYVKKIQ